MNENEKVVEDLEDLANREEMENYPDSGAKKSKKAFGPLIVAAIGVVVGGVALFKHRKKNRKADHLAEEPDDEDYSLEVEDLDEENSASDEEFVEETPEKK